MNHTIEIKSLEPNHWPEVKVIFEQGLATGVATFETESPSWKEWDSSHLQICRLVAIINDHVAGWIALSPVSNRCVYGGVGEISVYIHKDYRGKGIGKVLLAEVIKVSEENGYWTLEAGVMPENVGSVKLHESLGFRVVGYREKISKINGIWRDNLILERRSKIAGND